MKLLGWVLFLVISSNANAVVNGAKLEQSLQKLVADSDGRIGICAFDTKATEAICINGEQKFPLQSVMKLVVGAAVMDAIDRKQMTLSDVIVLRPQDASPGPQEFADLIRAKGSLKATVEELVRRAIVDSDSTSVDVLIERIGGVATVQDFLKRKQVNGISIDRDERHLQAESAGLSWKEEYADSNKFEAAVKALPEQTVDAAWNFYLKDQRDTATPVGMVNFLKALTIGTILSESSTKKLLEIMEATVTGRDRLKAGIPKNWELGHKTGTGRSWKGMNSVTNDVGILTAPDGGKIAVTVFVAESKRSSDERAGIIARTAKLVTSAYEGKK